MATWTKSLVILNTLTLFFWGSSLLAGEPPKLAFVRGGNIWIANSDGTQSRQLTYSFQDRWPAVSPDGKLIVYHSGLVEGSGSGQIFLIPATGGMVKQFRHPEVQGAEQPCFTPDGKQLLFVEVSDLKLKKNRGSEYGFATISLSLADLAGGKVRRIISHHNTNLDMGYAYSHPAIAGDGRLIAYQQSSGFSVGFAVIDLQGKSLYRFPKKTREALPYLRPQFSPDGREMLCWSPDVDKNKDVIYLVNLATGKQTPLALGSNPTYVDHGKAIVYQRWAKERRTSATMTEPDLWRLDLKAGATPKMISADAAEPAGQMP